MTFNQTHDTRHPLIIQLAYCGCPDGDYRATIAKYGIVANHDEPAEAVCDAIAELLHYDEDTHELILADRYPTPAEPAIFDGTPDPGTTNAGAA